MRIHVLRGLLRQTEDEYRDLLGAMFDGRRSSTALTPQERARFVAHLEALHRASAPQPKRPPLTPRQRKMFSLWQQLCDAGLARERGMQALQTWVQHQTKVESWVWLNSHQEDTVIESLKRWLKRADARLSAGAEAGAERGHG